jgi:hypothetical protein
MEVTMKTVLAIAAGTIVITGLLSDTRRFVLASQRWERDCSAASFLHLATSGFFLAEDVAVLK